MRDWSGMRSYDYQVRKPTLIQLAKLLTLNIFHVFFQCFYCAGKSLLNKFLMENGMTLETLSEIKKAKFIEYSTICDRHTQYMDLDISRNSCRNSLSLPLNFESQYLLMSGTQFPTLFGKRVGGLALFQFLVGFFRGRGLRIF